MHSNRFAKSLFSIHVEYVPWILHWYTRYEIHARIQGVILAATHKCPTVSTPSLKTGQYDSERTNGISFPNTTLLLVAGWLKFQFRESTHSLSTATILLKTVLLFLWWCGIHFESYILLLLFVCCEASTSCELQLSQIQIQSHNVYSGKCRVLIVMQYQEWLYWTVCIKWV